MNDITRIPQRQQPAQRQAPRAHHPEVVNFMDRVRDTEIERDNLLDENARLLAELHAIRQTVIDQAQLIRELTAQRDRETRKSVALEVHIKGIANACHVALKAAIEAEKAAEETARINEETPEEREERAAQHMRDTYGGTVRQKLIDETAE